MKAIAIRKNEVGTGYGLLLLLGIVVIVLYFILDFWCLAFIGLFYSIAAIMLLISFFRAPEIAITQNKYKQFHLSNGIVLDPTEINDVSYKRAFNCYHMSKWGMIKINTNKRVFKFNYITDVEKVGKYILKEMIIVKNNGTKF